RGLGPFLAGGARFVGRFLRLAVLSILLLALATWLARVAWEQLLLRAFLHVPAADFGRLETLASERTAFLARGAHAALTAILVALVFTWGDYTRTRIALFDARSVVWAGLGSAVTLLAHPIRALRPVLALFLCEVAAVTLGGLLVHRVDAHA